MFKGSIYFEWPSGSSRYSKVMRKLIISVVFILTVIFHGYAQRAAQTFSVHGRVTDHSGKVLPRATAAVYDAARTKIRETSASDSGTFAFYNLVPGSYLIDVSVTGYRLAVSKFKLPIVRSACRTSY